MDETGKTKNKIEVAGRLLFVFAISVALIAASVWVANRINPDDEVKNIAKEVVKEIVRPLVNCPRDFENFQKQAVASSVELITEKTFVNAKGGIPNDKVITVARKGAASKIACGYLYIVAGVADRPLEKWENVFMSPRIFGGHLVEDRALVSKSINDEKTEILFSLGEISYRKTKDREENVLTVDWAALLNVSDEITFEVYVNANNGSAYIERMIIAYKCWNPETGEETSDCSLQIE